MARDKYAETVDALNDLISYLCDIHDKGILTKKDIIKEVDGVFKDVPLECPHEIIIDTFIGDRYCKRCKKDMRLIT